MSRFHYDATLTFDAGGTDVEIDVTVSFAVSWGAPERGPSYACGGTPADPDEISDITLLEVGGKPRPWGWNYWSDGHFSDLVPERLFASEHHLERMLEQAAEARADLEDAIQERRWEDRREGFAA